MQILHRFAGSIQRYSEELSDPGRYRPDHCPQCEAHRPLRAHGFGPLSLTWQVAPAGIDPRILLTNHVEGSRWPQPPRLADIAPVNLTLH